MKAVFLVYNQANTERVDNMFDRLAIRRYTAWEQVTGRGSIDGEPHLGNHTWPEMNSAVLTMVEDDRVDELLKFIKKLDERNKEIGVRAFVWNIEKFV